VLEAEGNQRFAALINISLQNPCSFIPLLCKTSHSFNNDWSDKSSFIKGFLQGDSEEEKNSDISLARSPTFARFNNARRSLALEI